MSENSERKIHDLEPPTKEELGVSLPELEKILYLTEKRFAEDPDNLELREVIEELKTRKKQAEEQLGTK